MRPPGVIVVLDPNDDAAFTRQALAAHRIGAGVMTIHPTPGRLETAVLARDVLIALGKRADRVTDTSGIKAEEPAWRAGAAWTIAYRIRTVAVLRAHLLRRAHWERLLNFQYTTGVRLLMFCHCADVPVDVNRPLAGVEHTITDDLTRVVELLRPRPADLDLDDQDEELPAPPVPESFPIVPRTAVTRFRADAWRGLSDPEFAAADAQYRYGKEAACAWLAGQREYAEATPDDPLLAPEVMPRYLSPRESAAVRGYTSDTFGLTPARSVITALLCVGRERPSFGRYPRYPYEWRDLPGLQVFLSALVADCPSPEASLTRIRGAQAGFLLHGMLLSVPRDLRTAQGPGLTGTALESGLCQRLGEYLPNPVHAAALAITLAAGVPLAQLGHLRMASVGVRAEAVRANGCFAIPPAARPLLLAARTFRRLCGAQDQARLLVGPRGAEGVVPGTLEQDARACGVAAPAQTPYSDTPFLVPPAAWHVKARCWFVADPLHGPRQREPELGHVP